jgi:hypothetical protein
MNLGFRPVLRVYPTSPVTFDSIQILGSAAHLVMTRRWDWLEILGVAICISALIFVGMVVFELVIGA